MQRFNKAVLQGICMLFAAFIVFAGVAPVAADPQASPLCTSQDIEKPGKINGLPGLKNFGVVEKGIYRGAQPTSEGYATLKRMGVKSVLNLRIDKDEKSAVESAGMKPLEVPMGMLRHVDRESVDKAVSLIADPANQPIFVHCLRGQDRTGVVVAAYRMEEDGWALPAAEREMQSYGFNDVWVNLKHLIHKLAADMGKTR